MAGYPELEQERRVGSDALRGAVARIFLGCGMSEEDAHLLAHSLAWADLRGIHSHGVLRVPEYAKKLLRDGVDPRGRPVVVKDTLAAIVIDGRNAMGQIAASFAMDKAIARAEETNVAVASVRGSNHCGAMGYYVRMAMDRGMIGIAATNALPTMAPWGGKDKIVGINPLAVGIPAGDAPPVLLDCAFSYSSHGKLRVFEQKSAPVPPTWAFDREGKPTTNAAEALDGLLQPIGEYKGVGLAIVFGLLATALSGASYGTESGNMIDGAKPGHDGHIFMAIRIAAFDEPAAFKARIDRAVRQIETSRPAGDAALYAPGGIEAQLEARYRREGIPLNQATLDGINRVAGELNIEGI